jgi:hypothetical protein
MNNDWNVQGFLEQLTKAQNSSTVKNEQPKLSRTYLSINENLGKYQIFPMTSTVTGMPFEYLYRTKEVNMPTGSTDPNGKARTAWYKLLPLCAYDFVDSTGRRVSSLTQSERELLESAYGVFDRMWAVIPEEQRKDICRVKNYTIGNAYVINKYKLDNTVDKSGYCTLLICTSKDFASAIKKDIEMQMITFGSDPSWLGQIYNRQLENRTGWLIFSITVNQTTRIGFSVSANHTCNIPTSMTAGLKISAEDAELMKDPIRTFLGWQAGETKLFNEQVITSIIEEMNRTIAKYSNSAVYANPAAAVQATVATAQSVQAAPTNDPMLAGMNAPQQNVVMNAAQMGQVNNDPFVTPPAAQVDPITGMPANYAGFQAQPQVAPQQVAANLGYQAPAFAQNAQAAQPQPINPFDVTAPNGYTQG